MLTVGSGPLARSCEIVGYGWSAAGPSVTVFPLLALARAASGGIETLVRDGPRENGRQCAVRKRGLSEPAADSLHKPARASITLFGAGARCTYPSD